MLLPVGTVGRDKHNAIVTKAIIFINALVFMWEMLVLQRGGEPALLQALMNVTFNACEIGIKPAHNLAIDGLRSMFLHGSLMHIVGNMLFLWVFGRKVEAYFGSLWYALFYVVAGYFAIFGHIVFGGIQCSTITDGLLVGASGAIAGVMGAFLFLHPSVQIKTFIVIKQFRIPAIFFLAFWFAYDFILGIGWFAADGDNVAHWAHIGGFVFGFALVFLTTMFFKPAPKPDPFAYLDD